jgi:hypothetical protein
MAHTYQPLDEKDDIESSDGESQDNESLLGTRKPHFTSLKSNVFWIVLHVLVTLGLLIGLRIQSGRTTDTICPKLLPLELRKSLLAYQYC